MNVFGRVNVGAVAGHSLGNCYIGGERSSPHTALARSWTSHNGREVGKIVASTKAPDLLVSEKFTRSTSPCQIIHRRRTVVLMVVKDPVTSNPLDLGESSPGVFVLILMYKNAMFDAMLFYNGHINLMLRMMSGRL